MAERQLTVHPLHDLTPRLGEAWFPAVVDDIPGVPGMLLLVRTQPLPGGDHRMALELDRELTDAAHRWVAGLLGVWNPRVLELPSLYVTAPPPGVTVRGASGQLAGLVALLSHVLGVPPRAAVLCSGALGEPGKLASVERLDEKRAVQALEAPSVEPVFVDAPLEAASVLVRWLGEGWRADLEEMLRLSPQALAREAYLGHRGDRSLAEAKAREAIRLGQGHTCALGEWVVGACLMHKGLAGEGLERMERAATALAEPPAAGDAPLEAYMLEELFAFQGIALLDRMELRRARQVLERGLSRMDAQPLPLDQRAASVAVQLAGSLHRVLLVAGEIEAAECVLLEWSLGRALLPHEESRSRADLAELYRRAGRLDDARDQLVLARARLRHAPSDQRAFTGRFQRLFRVRAGLESPCWPVEPPRWRAWPQPGEVLETLLNGPGDGLDAWLSGHVVGMDLDPASSVVYLQLSLGAVARFAARTGELVSSAAPLVAALRGLLPELDPGVGGALDALLAGEPGEWVRRCPY
jgi:tetratricopeptide (TPR) repeat protein